MTFEIADNQDAPAWPRCRTARAGKQPTWRVASGILPVQAYRRDAMSCVRSHAYGSAVGVLVRPSSSSVRPVQDPSRAGAVAAASLSFARPCRGSTRLANEGELLTQMLDMVEKR